MNVVVCVKQIPDPASPYSLDESTYLLKREGKMIMDESDSYGVEVGLQLTEKAGGGEVVLVSMAPNDEVSGLRNALSMGASRAILVSDPRLAGSDALTTAKVIAKAVEKESFDVLVAATESTDGYTGTVPVQVAELLGLPSVTFAKKVDLEGGKLVVQRQTEAGYDVVECDTPVVITVTAGAVEPRFPNFKSIMQAKNKPISILRLEDLGLPEDQVGIKGARQEVFEARPAEEKGGGQIVEDDGSAHERIIAYLEELKVI
jgi:electron transfer flavoprotein beta subunit